MRPTGDPGTTTGWTDPIVRALEEIRGELAGLPGGELAAYIPQLTAADPSWFGLALTSLEGHCYAAGDADVPFTVQSVSKPFVLALALRDLGPEAVATRVGAEPSGEAFNAISLEPGSGRPENPMVNAGAIVTSSLVEGTGATERFERIRACLSAFAGRRLDVDEAVFESERATGDRNRALAYLMRNAGSLEGDIDRVLDVYFRQCSLLVTAADLATMAATLANGGVNPVTGEEVVDRSVTAHVLTIMATCGMYDYAGEWLLRVGLPAKSGVSGGLVAASPGQFGIGLFSPPIDAVGNSVRAVAASEVISDRFGLHLMRVPARPARPVYLSGTGEVTRSSRTRRRAERHALDGAAHAIAVRGIRGDIEFAEAEILVRSLAEAPAGRVVGWSVVDLHRVTRIHPAARRILAALIAEIVARDVVVAIADPAGWIDPSLPVERFPSLDAALEWCEDELLTGIDPGLGPDAVVPLAGHDLLASLDDGDRARLEATLEPRRLAVGDEVLADEGELFVLLLAGRLGTVVRAPGGGPPTRVGSLGPGTALSHLRLLNAPGGSRHLRAEVPSEVVVLRTEGLDDLERQHPGITGRLWTSLTGWLAGLDGHRG
jgi:glutaminase